MNCITIAYLDKPFQKPLDIEISGTWKISNVYIQSNNTAAIIWVWEYK